MERKTTYQQKNSNESFISKRKCLYQLSFQVSCGNILLAGMLCGLNDFQCLGQLIATIQTVGAFKKELILAFELSG